MASQAIENYLKAVAYLEEAGSTVSTTSLSAHLGVKPASVTGMLKRMRDLSLIRYRPYKAISLTARGRTEATKVIRRHRLIELFLVDVLGLGWDKVHAEADRLEHVVSDEVVERMNELLGKPSHDPHGAPIPRSNGTIERTGRVRLSSLTQDESGVISEVDDREPELLRYLEKHGIRPGQEIRVISKELGGVITMALHKKKVVIGQSVADKILVEKIV